MSADNTIGIRLSADAKELQAALNSGSGYIDGFATSARKSLNSVSKETDGLNASMESMANGIKSAFVGSGMAVGLIGLKNMVSDVGQELIATQIAADKLRNGLKFAVGGNAVAAEMDFLRSTTQKMGLEFVSASEQYMKLAAAAKGTALEGRQTRDIFTGISQASTVLGMSAQGTEGALRAVGQMISKNTIMSEELKGQLSEHLPGGFQIAARAMGVTTEQLNKMLETGQVVATDFLPKFAAELTKTFGPDMDEASKSMQASMNRMSNAWTDLKRNFNDSGAGKALQNEVQGMGNYVQSVSDAMERARQNGSGTLMQWSAALGEMIARAPFDVLSLASNTLNGSLNFLSMGALKLNTDLNLLPTALDTNRKRMDAMVAALPQAQADFERLSAALAKVPDNIYLKSELHQLAQFIEKAKEAKIAKDRLDGKTPAEDPTSAGITASGRAREAFNQRQKKAEGDLLAIRQKISGVDKDYIPTLEKLQNLRELGMVSEAEYIDVVSGLAKDNYKKPHAEKQATAYDTLRASIAKNMAMAQEEMASNGRVSASERQRIDSLNAINEALAKKNITAKQARELTAGANDAADARAVAEANTEQQKYIKTISEKIGIQQLAAQGTTALTDGQKLAAKFTQDLADGTLVLSEAHKIERTELLERLIASEQQNAAMQEQEKLQATEIKHLQDSTASMLQKAMQIEDEVALYGMSEEAIKALTIARLEDEKAIQMSYGNTTMVDALEARIAVVKRLAKAQDALKVKDDSAEAAKHLAAEMQKAADEINRTLTDSLMRAFENGEGYGRAFAKTVEAMFKTMVLRPIVSAVMTPISGAVSSVLGGIGLPGTASAASGAGSSVGNVSSLLGSAGSLFGAGFKAGIGSVFGEAGIAGGFSAGTTAIGAGNIAGGVGTLAGVGTTLLAGVAALSAVAKAMQYTVEATGSALVANLGGGGSTVVANRNDYQQTGGLFGGGVTNNSDWSAASAETTAYFDAQVKAVTEAARAYGTALGLPVGDLDNFKQQIEVSLTGLNADQAKEAINKAVAGFGDAMVSANFGTAIESMKKGGETASATLVRVATEITTVNSTLGMLGGKLLSVDAAGIKAADGLVQAMGGLEAFQQQTASYYESYYSEEEKRLNTAKNIQSQLANAGIDVSLEQVLNGTKEQFRALVESFTSDSGNLDEAGQTAVAALMKVASAFAGIANIEVQTPSASTAPTGPTSAPGGGYPPYSAEWYAYGGSGAGTGTSVAWTGSGASDSGSSIADERKSLQDQLDELTMTNTQLLEKQRNAIDESNRALWDQVQAAEAAKAASDERKTLQDQYNQLTMTETQLRELERETIAESNRELYDKITALQQEQAITAQGKTLQEQYNQLTMSSVELRAIERESIDAANLALFDKITALQQEQAITAEGNSLQDQYNKLTMSSVELRALERESIDEANLALFDSITALQEQAAITAEGKTLQDQYNQLTMTSAELRALERETIAEGNLEIFDKITALQKEQAIAAEGKTLQDQYNQLTMTSAELRALERESIDEANLSIFDKITLLQQEKLAAAATQDYQLQMLKLKGEAGAEELAALQQTIDTKAKLEAGWTQEQIDSLHALEAASTAAAKAQELLKTKLDLQSTLYELTGDSEGSKAVLEAQRALQLAALDPSLRELQKQIWGLQDAASASAAALAAAKENSNTAMAALERAVGAQRKVYQAQVEAAQEAVNDIKNVFDVLHSSVKELYGQVDSTAAMQAAQGREFVSQALSAAQKTGFLPESDRLSEAIAAAKGGASEFASQFEKDFASLSLAGELSQLEAISGDQLTNAERSLRNAEAQLASLDGVLDLAKQQLDAANGIDTSIKSVAEAVQALAAAIDAQRNAAAGTGEASTVYATSDIAAANASSMSGLDMQAINAARKHRYEMSLKSGDIDAAGAAAYRDALAAGGTRTDADAAWKAAIAAAEQAAGWKAGGFEQLHKAIFTSQEEAAKVMNEIAGLSAEVIAAELEYYKRGEAIREAAIGGTKLPSYAVGTNYVPNDQIAQLHKGEIVVPAAYNPAAGGQPGNARLESLVEGLTKEVQRLQGIVNEGNLSNERIATAVNGQPDRPMLVETT